MEVFFWGKNLRQIDENLRNRFLLFSIKLFLGNYLINKTQILYILNSHLSVLGWAVSNDCHNP